MREGIEEAFLVPVETTEQELTRLRKEKREWEIAAYVFFGLFFLLWLSRR